MGLSRRAPHSIRATYATALNAIPLPVRAISAPIAEALTVLGAAEIGGRHIQYGTATAAPRLWVAFTDTTPPVFGYLSDLVSENPILQVTDQRHLAWTRAADHTDQLKRHGLEVWHQAQRSCEG